MRAQESSIMSHEKLMRGLLAFYGVVGGRVTEEQVEEWRERVRAFKRADEYAYSRLRSAATRLVVEGHPAGEWFVLSFIGKDETRRQRQLEIARTVRAVVLATSIQTGQYDLSSLVRLYKKGRLMVRRLDYDAQQALGKLGQLLGQIGGEELRRELEDFNEGFRQRRLLAELAAAFKAEGPEQQEARVEQIRRATEEISSLWEVRTLCDSSQQILGLIRKLQGLRQFVEESCLSFSQDLGINGELIPEMVRRVQEKARVDSQKTGGRRKRKSKKDKQDERDRQEADRACHAKPGWWEEPSEEGRTA